MSTHTEIAYVAGKAAYLYPELGDALPPGGAKVLLLSEGGICIVGCWTQEARNKAWSPLPKRGDYVRPDNGGVLPGSENVLLLTEGGICVTGAWSKDGRYQGWAPMPKRDRAREQQLAGATPPRRRMAA